jgi:hypothetical protein
LLSIERLLKYRIQNTLPCLPSHMGSDVNAT